MSRIAVIGAGISGMAAAYFLSRNHEVHLFEREPRLGGHTDTQILETEDGPLAVDTGFIVHNNRTYPNLVRLLAELNVETQPSDMSFAVTCHETGFEYSSRGANGYFAQRRNLLRPAHYKLLAEIMRFNREAPRLLEQKNTSDVTLDEYLKERRFNGSLVRHYLYPMACAIWSTAPREIGSFPAATLIRFFENHGMLGINTHPQWKSVKGGSSRYIAPLTQPYASRIHTRAKIRALTREAGSVTLHFTEAPAQSFDEAVLACHGPQALALLDAPTHEERAVLGKFSTSRNAAWLHTDANLLPRRAQARASWNYNLGLRNGHSRSAATLTYHMNRLQSLQTRREYCVSLNAEGAVREEKVLRRLSYDHPLYNREAVSAQARWSDISGRNRTHFCGAYWLYGFHEDGVNSALRVAKTLGVDW
jgi:predicted NAD/FAD-binding protein